MNVALHPEQLRTLSLCSGGGGLDLGFGLAVQRARTVCYVEREAFAAAHLVEAMAHGLVDDAPVWSDLGTFDCEPWRGVVDCILAGWPCPPYSAAGKRRGADDERDLWPDVFRIVAALRPRLFAGENVAGFASHPDGLARTVRDLQGIGYRVAATLVTAADVGASHERERCFLLAHAEHGGRGAWAGLDARSREPTTGRSDVELEDAARDGWGGQDGEGGRRGRRRIREAGEQLADAGRAERRGHEESAGEPGRRAPSDDRGAGRALADTSRARSPLTEQGELRDSGRRSERRAAAELREPVADADGMGAERESGSDGATASSREDQGPQRERVRPDTGHGGEGVADANGRGLGELGQPNATGLERASGDDSDGRDVPLFPPGSSAYDEWRRILKRDPSLAPALEPPFRLLADGVAADRRHFLRLFGNGVVPLQAAYAFCTLLAGVEVS